MKDEVRDTAIQFRVSAGERAQYQRCADAEDRSMSSWVRLQCRRAVKTHGQQR